MHTEEIITMLAADIFPAQALSAIFGLGLKEASNWSLRAAGRRTTLLLVWDKEENNEDRGALKYKRTRGKQRRGPEPFRKFSTPSQPSAHAVTPPRPPEKGPKTVQDDAFQLLQGQIAALSAQVQGILPKVTSEAATSPIVQPVPEKPVSIPPPPPPQQPPAKKSKAKGKKGVMTTSTPTPIQSPGPAVELEKKIGGASDDSTRKTPTRPVPAPAPFEGLEREAVKRELELREVCRELHLSGLVTDKRKAQQFITAVMHMGFRSLQTSPPRRQQWYSAVQFLSKQHWDLFRECLFCQLSDVAESLGVRHGIYFPKQQRKEVRTAKQLADWEENRGTFHQME